MNGKEVDRPSIQDLFSSLSRKCSSDQTAKVIVDTLDLFWNGSGDSATKPDILLSAKLLLFELGVIHGIIPDSIYSECHNDKNDEVYEDDDDDDNGDNGEDRHDDKVTNNYYYYSNVNEKGFEDENRKSLKHWRIKSEIPRVTKPVQFHCSICGKGFHNPVIYKLHRQRHNYHYCGRCRLGFSHYNLLKRHQRFVHTDSVRISDNKLGVDKLGVVKLGVGKLGVGKLGVSSKKRVKWRKCIYCHVKYKTRYELIRHVKSSHCDWNNSKNCVDCYRYLRTVVSRALKVPLEGSQIESCSICKTGFSFYGNLKSHWKRRHYRLDEYCFTCDKEHELKGFSTLGGKYDKCKNCKRIYFTCHLADHVCVLGSKKSSNGKRQNYYTCSYCPEPVSFDTQKLYNGHLKDAHNVLESNVCYICGVAYNSKYYLESHIRSVHNKIRDYRCETCGKELGCKTSLENHVNSVHLKLKRFHCDQCGLRFGVKQRLTLHIRNVHLKIKDQQCPYCEACYIHRTTLKEHIKYTHHGHERVKRFMCDKCHKCFVSNCSLQGHIKFAHYGIREYNCRICGKAFGTTNMRRKHERMTHDPNTKHRNPNVKLDVPCDICHKMFGRKGTMERHKLLVHEERRDFRCELCGKSYQQRCDLTKHEKKWHPR